MHFNFYDMVRCVIQMEIILLKRCLSKLHGGGRRIFGGDRQGLDSRGWKKEIPEKLSKKMKINYKG
jgi:hypothetical protein